jgi:hypothetical protein
LQSTSSKPSTNRVRQIAEPPHEAQLPAQLESSLWDQLTWVSLGDDDNQRQTLIESYISSLNQLDRFRRETEAFIRAACLVNLEFRQSAGATHGQARDEAMNARLDEMLTAASAEWLPTRNILDGMVVSQTGPALREQLDQALRASLHDFTTNFFDLLSRLVDRQLVGLVEWLPNHCCSYHFFKQVVIQENEGARKVVYETMVGVSDDALRTTIDTRGKGRHIHRLARHEHAVINAVRTSIANSQVVIPPPVKALIEQVPDWLYPFLSIIDGDIVRERIIERDMRVENWQDVVVLDEPIYGLEPGVIIGPYVLTGWGPREVAAEQARRKAQQASAQLQQSQKIAAWRAPCFAVGAAVMLLLAMVFLGSALGGHGGGIFALLATMAAIGAAWQATFDFLYSRKSRASVALATHWLTASLGCQLLMALWLVARWYGPLSWSVPIVLGGTAVVCYAIARRFL